MAIDWANADTLPTKSYVCGYCGGYLASQRGYYGHERLTTGTTQTHRIYVCHVCSKPTFFTGYGTQYPGAPFGEPVQHIPSPDIQNLYDEARNAISVNAFTGSVLSSRKLLMNIAVANGAKEGLAFMEYVDYLATKGYVPPNGREWVDHIRQKGNEATHQIAIMKREDAEELITFVEALLRFIYEYPGMMAARKAGKPA